MAGISSITGSSISTGFQFSGTNSQKGSAYTGQIASANVTKRYNLGTANSNAQSGGCDEVFSFQQTIAGGGSATIDLFTMTNILAQASVNIVRIKGWQIRNLNSTDDSTIVTPSSTLVTVTTQGPSVPAALDLGSGGTGATVTLTTAAGSVTSVGVGAGGSGYLPSATFLVAPQQTGGSGCLLTATTNASGVVTSMALVTGGSGYVNGTVGAVEIGQHPLAAGGAHMHFDVSTGGFCPLSSTARNFLVVNQDAAHTATIEIDVFGCTT